MSLAIHAFDAILALKVQSVQGIEFASLISTRAAASLVSAVWQSFVLAGCVWICLKLAPRTTAGLRFAIWASTFGVAVLVPLLGQLPRLASSVGAPATSVAKGPWLQLDARWSIGIAALWTAIGLYRAAGLVLQSIRLRQLWRRATPVSLAGRYSYPISSKGTRQVELCITRDLDRPGVIGFLRPRILIPEWLYDQLSSAELEQIVLHETEHLRRGDDWSNLLQKLCLIVFPLNPVLLWIERRLCIEREMACDEGVVRITHAPRAYASVLARLAERGLAHGMAGRSTYREEALSLGFCRWDRRSELVLRVHSILLRKAGLNPVLARSLSAVLVLGLVMGAAELSRSPQLVAFVPLTSATETARTVKPGSSFPETAAAHAEFERVAWRPLANARMTASKSEVAATSAQDLAPRHVAARHVEARLDLAPNSAGTRQPQAEMIRSEMPANLAASQTPEQGWITVTRWEESVVAAPASLDTVHGETSSGHLLVQVVSARVSSQHFAAVPTRNGWLVFQL